MSNIYILLLSMRMTNEQRSKPSGQCPGGLAGSVIPSGPQQVDLLNEQGGGRGKQAVLLPHQHAAGHTARLQRDEPQAWIAADGQRAVHAERAAQPFGHQQGGVGKQRVKQRDAQFAFPAPQPVQDLRPDVFA